MAVIFDLQPDIVLCDVRMQGASGLDLCREIRKRDPQRKVILLSVYDDEQYLSKPCGSAHRAICSRASAAMSWCASWKECTRARRRSMPGWPRGLRRPRRGCRVTSSGPAPGTASPSASEILSLVVTGLSNRGIAGKLVIGEETVKTHLSSIYRKLGVSDRTSAAATALREGIFR